LYTEVRGLSEVISLRTSQEVARLIDDMIRLGVFKKRSEAFEDALTHYMICQVPHQIINQISRLTREVRRYKARIEEVEKRRGKGIREVIGEIERNGTKTLRDVEDLVHGDYARLIVEIDEKRIEELFSLLHQLVKEG